MGRRKNVPAGPVVLLQLYDLRLRKILFKVQNVPYVGASPLVYALVVVAYDAEVVVSLGKKSYEPVLNMVGVLILVHHYVSEPVLIFCKNPLILLQQPYGVEKKVVEVHGVVCPEILLVLRVKGVNDLCLVVDLGAGFVILRRHLLFLAVAYDRENVCRRKFFVVYVKLLQDSLHQSLLIRRVVNYKSRVKTQNLSVNAKKPQAHGVKCHYPHIPAGGNSRYLLHPASHLSRSLVGEGDGQNVVRAYSLLQ